MRLAQLWPLTVCVLVCVSHTALQKRACRGREMERKTMRERQIERENTTWVFRPVPKGHTQSLSLVHSVFVVLGEGSVLHTPPHTYTLFYIFLFPLLSQSMIEWFLKGSSLFLPLSLSLHHSWQSSTFPPRSHLYHFFIGYFSLFHSASVGRKIISSHTLSFFFLPVLSPSSSPLATSLRNELFMFLSGNNICSPV